MLFKQHNTSCQVVSIELMEKGYAVRYVYHSKKLVLGDRERFSAFDDITDLNTVLKKNVPLLVHFFGKGVICRKTEQVDDYLDSVVVNANKTDFYAAYVDSMNQRFVAYTRKEKVDEILAALDPWKDLLVDVKLGPFVLLDFAKENRLTTFSDIVFTDDFSDFKVLPDKENAIRFEGAELDETIYPYVVGLSFNQDNHSVSILPLEEVKSRKENLSEKKQFEKLGVFALVFFLVALTGNYFYQGSLITKNSEIEEKIMIYSDNLNKIDLLDQEIKRKTQLITTSGIVKQNFISFYLDRIASTVPDKITLKDVKAFPAQKKIKQKVKPEFEQNSIFIDGTTSSTGAIDEWIEKLNQLEWIDKTEIIHFEQNQEKRVANFSFRLTIK